MEKFSKEEYIDILKEIGNIGAGNATTALSFMIDSRIELSVPKAEVIDFKSMEVPDDWEEFDWREMSLQVQLYSRAAKEVIGENAETGYVHILKNNKRVEVPVDETAVKNAIGAIEWAVKGILQEDFPGLK